jgi:hypothetical protein
MSYRIIRMFFNDSSDNYVVEEALTLAEAREHCKNKETSSKTATSAEAVKLTEEKGIWFDGYEEEED